MRGILREWETLNSGYVIILCLSCLMDICPDQEPIDQ